MDQERAEEKKILLRDERTNERVQQDFGAALCFPDPVFLASPLCFDLEYALLDLERDFIAGWGQAAERGSPCI